VISCGSRVSLNLEIFDGRLELLEALFDSAVKQAYSMLKSWRRSYLKGAERSQ
jgi:hypothetical protein